MKYVYHYHAIFQPQPGNTAHIDGILSRDSQVDSADEFIGVRAAIAERNDIAADKLTVCSLSIIATKPE